MLRDIFDYSDGKYFFQKPYFFWILGVSLVIIIVLFMVLVLPYLKSLIKNPKRFKIIKVFTLILTCSIYIFQLFFEKGYGYEGVTFWFFHQYYLIIPLFLLIIIYNVLTFHKKNTISSISSFDSDIKSSSHTILSKKIFKIGVKVVEISLLIVIILQFLINNDLLNNEIIILDDYAYNYYLAWYANEIGFPFFRSIFSYNPFFYAGIPEGAYFTPGLTIFSYLFSQINISLELIQRFFIILVILGCFLLPLAFLKILKISKKFPFFFGFYSFLIGYWIKILHNGQIGFLLASITALYCLILIVYLFQIKSKSLILYLIAGILMGVSLLLHFKVITFLIFSLGVFLIYWRKTLLKNKIWLAYLLFTLIWGISIVLLFWIVPALHHTLIYLLPDMVNSPENNYLSLLVEDMFSQYSSYNIKLFFHLVPFFLWPMIIIGMIISFKKKNVWEMLLNTLNLLLIAYILFTNIIPGLESLSTSRLFIFNEFLFFIPIIRSLEDAQSYLKNSKVKIQSQQVINSFYFLLLFFSIYGINDKLNSPFFLYTNYDPVYPDLEDWLTTNNDEFSRVLMEDLPHDSPYSNQTEHAIALLSMNTNTYFVGGYRTFIYFSQTYNTSSIAGYAFNMAFEEMNITYFIEQLTLFNIHYIIGWSEPFRSFMDENVDEFPLLESIGDYSIYNNTNFHNNNFLIDSNSDSEIIAINNQPNLLEYSIINASAGDLITIVMFDYSNWHIFIDGVEMNKLAGSDLIQFIIPQSGNISVTIKWVVDNWELGASFANYFMIVLTIPLIWIIQKKIKKMQFFKAFYWSEEIV